MSFDLKIKALENGLTDSEQKVANYISDNIKKVPYQSIYEVADCVGTSVGTVTRFTKKMGYPNYKDFRVEIAKLHSMEFNGEFEEFSQDDNDDTLINKIFTANINMINDTLALTNKRVLSELAQILIKSKKILFFGIGGSGLVAQDAAIRFNQVDIDTYAYVDPVAMLLNAQRVNEDNVVVGVSHSGKTMHTIKSIELAKNNGATTVSITNYLNCPLNNFSDYKICTGFSENRVRTAALTSRVAQYCIIDVLYFLVVKNSMHNLDVKKINQLIEDNIRIK